MATTATGRSGSGVALEFRLRDSRCFFIKLSTVLDCSVHLEHVVSRSDGSLLEYFVVEDASIDQVRSLADETETVKDTRLVNEGADDILIEFVVTGRCVTTTLADVGAITQSVAATDGVGRVVANVPPHVETRRVVEGFQNHHTDADLVACRDRRCSVPVRTEHGAHVSLAATLTERQLEVLRTAYLRGYFSWPRTTTAEDCAEALSIAQPTFSQHVRTGQERLFDALFEADGPDGPEVDIRGSVSGSH